jgi:hypothetical protein
MIFIMALLRFALVLVGALDIRVAIRAFKDGYYFLGGLESMMAVWMVVCLVYTYFGG